MRKAGDRTKKSKLSPIPFRVSDEERKEISKAAERVGLTISAYIRARVLETPLMRATRRPSVEKEVLAKLLGKVGEIGGDIQQLQSRIKSGENIDGTVLSQTLTDVRAAASAIMQTMGRKPHDH